MYTIILAAVLSTGNEVPDFGRRGGGRGCHGGCYGGCYGGRRGGCYGGGWGGCYGGCWGGCYGGCMGMGYGGCWGGCYGGCWGGCGGGGMVISSGVGCCGGMAAGGCTGMMAGGGGGGGAGAAGGSGGGSGLGAGSLGGQGGASAELTEMIQDLKKSIEQLKKDQNQIRIEILKQVAEDLKARATEQKIDELRRTILELQRRLPTAPAPAPVPAPVPRPRPELPPPQPGKGEVRLDVPADALVFVNDRCLGPTSTFVTPLLQPGQEYVVNVETVAVRDGESVSRVKRLPVRAGEVVRLAYKDMEPAGTRWTQTDQKSAPAHVTVYLPADARLTVQGVNCPLTSEKRTIDTPELVPGKTYSYVLKAEVQRDGRTVAQTQNITFRSGERVAVSFEDLGARTLTKR